MYLWNTDDLYIDWWELSWGWYSVFMRGDEIYDTRDSDILEDNIDMLPWEIIYRDKQYILHIHSFALQSWHMVYSLQYRWVWTNKHNIYENDWESVNELIRRFNEWKNQTGFPEEIRFIY